MKLLSDNGTQFTARFFQNVFRILGIRNVFTTTYHLPTAKLSDLIAGCLPRFKIMSDNIRRIGTYLATP